jgi:hypothetical protein
MHGTIDLAGDSHLRAARDRAQSIPLGDFDVSHPELFDRLVLVELTGCAGRPGALLPTVCAGRIGR